MGSNTIDVHVGRLRAKLGGRHRPGSRRCAAPATGWWRSDDGARSNRLRGSARASRATPSGPTPPRWPWGPPPSSGWWPSCWPWPPTWSSCATSTRTSTPGWPAGWPAASRGPIDPLATGRRRPTTAATSTTPPPSCGRCGPTAPSTALVAGAPRLPAHRLVAGRGDPDDGGQHLPVRHRRPRRRVAGGRRERRDGSARSADQLLIAEVVLGALLLVVTFVGSFMVGLRASAPIEQIRRRQAEFTADASHELRTPLSVIEAEVDLALGRERERRRATRTPCAGWPRRAAGCGPSSRTCCGWPGPTADPPEERDRPGGRRGRGGASRACRGSGPWPTPARSP